MKEYIYKTGTFALALVMSGLPATALAESGRGEAGVRVQALETGVSASVTVRADDEDETEATSSDDRSGRDDDRATSTDRALENIAERAAEQARERSRSFLFLKLESTTTPAFSLEELKRSVENRRHELDDEEASTTSEVRDVVKNANPVRLAVHTLLASKDLLGGIGGQVSEIAKHMNDSLATTTSVEVRVKTRGFLTRFLFGGDSVAADIIAKEVAENQARIDALTKLLADASVSADVQVVLKAQIAALRDAQVRLQALAEKEQGAWGLLSWRF